MQLNASIKQHLEPLRIEISESPLNVLESNSSLPVSTVCQRLYDW